MTEFALAPSAITGLVELWDEVENTVLRVLKATEGAAAEGTASWTGERSKRFKNDWWPTKQAGINGLFCGANSVSLALHWLHDALVPAASDLNDMKSSLRRFFETEGRYSETQDRISAGRPISESELSGGTLQPGEERSYSWIADVTKHHFRVELRGETGSPRTGDFPMPAALSEAKEFYDSAKRNYAAAMTEAATTLNRVKADMEVTDRKLIDVDSGNYLSLGATPNYYVDGVPFYVRRDESWYDLTGGDVFKPLVSGQFEEWVPDASSPNGFKARDLPVWLTRRPEPDDPWIIDALEWTGDKLSYAAVGAVLLYPPAVPYIVGAKVGGKIVEVGYDLFSGNDEAAEDSIDIIFDLTKTGGVQAVARSMAVKAGAPERIPEVLDETTGFIASKLKEKATDAGDGNVQISAAEMREIMEEAQARATLDQLQRTPAATQG